MENKFILENIDFIDWATHKKIDVAKLDVTDLKNLYDKYNKEVEYTAVLGF